MNDKNKNNKPSAAPDAPAKKPMHRRTRRGLYTAAVSAFVLAIVIAFNLLVGTLPSGATEFDITGKDLYTITNQSVDYLQTLGKDVEIVVFAQKEAIDETMLKLIERYAALSPHLSLRVVDPVLNPATLEAYGAQPNQVAVRCEATDKTSLINMAGIDGVEEGLILYDAESYYYRQQYMPVALDVEGQLTSAVNFVTTTETHKLYLMGGHGEQAFGTSATALIDKANIETQELNLLIDGSIPGDCELLICNSPSSDLADEELDLLKTYLRTGGNVMILLGESTLTNFNALLAVYGLEMQNGYIGDNTRYYEMFANQYGYFCIYPVLSPTNEVTASITSDAILRYARGMLITTPERRGAEVTPFMTTSEDGLLVLDEQTAVPGQYVLGATAVETFEDKDNITSRLTVITAVDLVSDETAELTSLSNTDIFLNALALNFDGIQNLNIPAKSLNVNSIVISSPLFWGALFAGIIPLGILVGGVVHWARRRRR